MSLYRDFVYNDPLCWRHNRKGPEVAMLSTSIILKDVALDAERMMEINHRDFAPWTDIVPFAIKTSGALYARSDFLLVFNSPKFLVSS